MSVETASPTAPVLPFTLPVLVDNIPVELRAFPQWVAWTWTWKLKDNRSTKVPLNARTGKAASVTDPTTWSTFEEAVLAYGIGEPFSGIGFVLTEQDPFTGIDLDKCRDRVTGEIASWAQAIIERFRSYTEISPSGRGVRIFIKGKLPTHTGRRKGLIEIYDHARYLTMTGHTIVCPQIGGAR